MARINERLAAAIAVVLEELPKVGPKCSSIDIGFFRSGGRPALSVSAQGRGICLLGSSHGYGYPDTPAEAVTQLERHLDVIEGPTISPREYADAEFGPIFGKAAA